MELRKDNHVNSGTDGSIDHLRRYILMDAVRLCDSLTNKIYIMAPIYSRTVLCVVTVDADHGT